jgi:hypothetical protein
MRWMSRAAAALLLLAGIAAWSGRSVPEATAAGGLPEGIARQTVPAPAPEAPLAGAPPDLDPGARAAPTEPAAPVAPVASVAPLAREAPPAPIAALPEVTVLVERADFEEAPLTGAGAGQSPPPEPAAHPGRSGDLVRRLLGLQEAMRE